MFKNYIKKRKYNSLQKKLEKKWKKSSSKWGLVENVAFSILYFHVFYENDIRFLNANRYVKCDSIIVFTIWASGYHRYDTCLKDITFESELLRKVEQGIPCVCDVFGKELKEIIENRIDFFLIDNNGEKMLTAPHDKIEYLLSNDLSNNRRHLINMFCFRRFAPSFYHQKMLNTELQACQKTFMGIIIDLYSKKKLNCSYGKE